MKKKIVITVISDLVTDQRVHKIATTLTQYGYKVIVIGATKKNSTALPPQLYTTTRISLLFQSGFVRYAEWNIRLFFKLFFYKTHLLYANDLDTLLPNYIHSKLRSKPLIYDSHEYFTEQEEVQHRPFVKKVWSSVEKFIFPNLKYILTVNNSIATIYQQLYKVPVQVLRNVPLSSSSIVASTQLQHYANWQNKKVILTQGTGINANRGYEELILSTKYLDTNYLLLIIGNGLILPQLKQLVIDQNLTDKVHFEGIMQKTELQQIAATAFCGITVDKPTCLNNVYSLPNKLFDFVQANLPVIASNMVEVAAIVNTYNVGIVLPNITPQCIATAIETMATNKTAYNNYKLNCNKAKAILTWENEAIVLKNILKKIEGSEK